MNGLQVIVKKFYYLHDYFFLANNNLTKEVNNLQLMSKIN